MASHYRIKCAIPHLCLLLLISAGGCSQAVLLTGESEQGGVMTYSYREDRGGPMGSPYRKQALDAIQHKCREGSRILREGEVKGYSSAGMGIVEGTEDESRGRRWGIQFECRVSDSTVERGSDAFLPGVLGKK